jgi:hypothetical protein
MDKKAALTRMNSLESEIKELRKIIEQPEKMTDRIKTVEDAFNYFGIDFNAWLMVCVKNGDTPDEIAYKKLKMVYKAFNINEKWVPDYDNSNQAKWYPYFKKGGSGFGFSGSCTYCVCTFTTVGSRLCTYSDEIATYIGKQFNKEYNEFLN